MKRKPAAPNFPLKRAHIEKKQHRRDKNPAILENQCNDNLSLFRAIRVGMFYYEKGSGKWEPAEHYARSSRLAADAPDFFTLFDVTLKQESYGLDDVKKVYEYLDIAFPETYRILVFTDTSDRRAVYNSGNNAKHNICLYYHDGHFDLMKTPQKFFRKKYYCVDCEKTYDHLKDHSECKVRCFQCFRIGHGYPCKGDLQMQLECPDCHKFFVNQDCMDAHKPCSCNTYHRCVSCNVQYRVRPERPNKGHRCDKEFPPTPDIAKESVTVPKSFQQGGFSCAKTDSTLHHGGVQRSILSYITREVTVF